MKTFSTLILGIGLALASAADMHNHIFSDDWISQINAKASTWEAGRNFHPETSTNYIKSLLGVHPMHKKFMPAVKEREQGLGAQELPTQFDPR